MSRRREGMTEKSCGCITYEYGPPHICGKHARKQQEAEEKGLRRTVRLEAERLGHTLTLFSEYESFPGKWTAYCTRCSSLVIVYDRPPERGDQLNGPKILERECNA